MTDEPTADEKVGFQLRLISSLVRDMLLDVRMRRAEEGLAMDANTTIRVLPGPLRVGQLEAWAKTFDAAAEVLDPADAYSVRAIYERRRQDREALFARMRA